MRRLTQTMTVAIALLATGCAAPKPYDYNPSTRTAFVNGFRMQITAPIWTLYPECECPTNTIPAPK